MTDHKELKKWIKEAAALCMPDRIVWIDGSEEEKKRLERKAFKTGELIKLNQKKLPGCIYHRTARNDVARTEGLTYICARKKSDTGPTNNWMPPRKAYAKARKIFKNSMKGRTMYVIPFSMGPVGSPFSKIGVELTDSIYVVLNMRIMTRVGTEVLKQLGVNGKFTKCLHSKAQLDIKKRMILHFPEDNTIWSVNSGYGGNVLLGKKCLALRIASFIAKKEGWMAEHMLILGVESPNGHIEYIAAAFPSACGKTNLAMLIPPKGLKTKGYKIWTVGDDIAWMRVDSDRSLWAINPEAGFFGVTPGTNYKSNSNAMAAISKNTIFTNALLKPDRTVWWEDSGKPPPPKGIDWKGSPWKPGMIDENGKYVPGAHPNSRFTAPAKQCPSISYRLDHHHGVPISAIVFGGRRARLAPLIYEAFNWQHGVFVGATMASERTAAQYGKLGEVRRDPMAMLPFCGYHMGDYFKHWLNMGKKMEKPARVFHVNWFRVDKKGKFMWPGYSENLRIIEWILDRCNDKIPAKKTPIGYIPRIDDIDITGLKLSKDTLNKLLHIDIKEWRKEEKDIEQFFKKFGRKLPKELKSELTAFKRRLKC
ncbi:MAG: phosphoenolpyruvate carboxykinase (GTP) [Candidatus Omnitrophota bacterium]|nr:phosphoenolpyruvate carboxykinase (GTP) [Candidatus Omnitrophota bacterium]